MRKENGLTLIELMISVLMISALVGAVVVVYDAGSRSFQSQFARSGLKGEAGRALENMGRDLRIATAVTTSSAAALVVTADVDGNGSSDTVSYSWSGVSGAPLTRTLTTTVPAATTAIQAIKSITSLAFTYRDAGNSSTTTPSLVRVVSMILTAAGPGESVTLQTSFKLRNL